MNYLHKNLMLVQRTINKPELININNKYYLAEVLNIEKVSRTLEDKEIKEVIVSQLKLKYIIENNKKLFKEMSGKGRFNQRYNFKNLAKKIK